jgi:hypothetical protein
MIVHCQKHQDGYFYSDAWQTIGREEDRQLAEELVKVFPAVRAVRFVPQDKHKRAGER